MTGQTKSSEWFHALYTKREDELLQMIKKEPDLMTMRLEFRCVLEVTGSSKKPCNCCISFETLQSDTCTSIDQMMSDFEKYLQEGHCQHLSPHTKESYYASEQTENEQDCEHQVNTQAQSENEISSILSTHAVNEHFKNLMTKHKNGHFAELSAQTENNKNECCLDHFAQAKSEHCLDLLAKTKNGLCPNLSADGHDSFLVSPTESTESDISAGITAIHVATAFGKKKILKEILKHFSKMSSKGDRTCVLDYNPLHISILHRKLDVFFCVIKRCRGLNEPIFTSCRKFPNDVIINVKCIFSMIAEFNGLEYLKLIHKYGKGRVYISTSVIKNGFFVSLCSKSYECGEYILHKFDVFSLDYCKYVPLKIEETTANILANSNDAKAFSLLLRVKYLDTANCISRFMKQGHKNYVMELFKHRQLIRETKNDFQEGFAFLVQAVIQDCPIDMLQVILKYGKGIDKKYCHRGYSGLDWACALGNKEAEKVMREDGIYKSKISNYPPLVAIFDVLQVCDFDLEGKVKTLIGLGHDVNVETTNGITPIIKAIDLRRDKSGSLSLVRYLLLNGADPFKGGVYFSKFMDNDIITEFLYCNINMCRGPFSSSFLRHILVTSYSSDLVKLILNFSHTIPADYKHALFHMHSLPEGQISIDDLNMFDNLFYNPRTLLILCRNSIRRLHGYRIHRFVQQHYLPSQVREILTLENELNR